MPAKEDTWTYTTIGRSLPDHPVRIPGQTNMYVALWYKNGKPCHGRAWNDGGRVACSFPEGKLELTAKNDLGEEIQILTYKGEFDDNGYWFQWLPIKTKDDGKPDLELIRCGMSTPIMMKTKDGKDLLGFLDLGTGVAMVGNNGKSESMTGEEVKNWLGIFRTLSPPPTGLKIYDDIFINVNMDQPFPGNAMPADNRLLLTSFWGVKRKQYVALWYQHGEPVFGSCIQGSGYASKILPSFAVEGVHYISWRVKSFMMLVTRPPGREGLQYAWRPWSAAKADGFVPVSVGHTVPCILKFDNWEELGNLNTAKECASIGYLDGVKVIEGAVCGPLLVLCKKRK